MTAHTVIHKLSLLGAIQKFLKNEAEREGYKKVFET